jgi:hypothetical protein
MRLKTIAPVGLAVVIAPHALGPAHGWYFRLDCYENVNDWHGPAPTRAACQCAAALWLHKDEEIPMITTTAAELDAETATTWHLTTVLTADDRERLQRLVDVHNATMLIHGERSITAQQWLAAQIPSWLAAQDRGR